MKYFEEHFLQSINEYLQGTYGQHYSINTIQLIDIWEAKGSLESTSIDVAQKYLFRYGKKDGFNRKDLLKAIHYIIIAMYARDKQEGKLPDETRTRKQVKNVTLKRKTRRHTTKRSGPKNRKSVQGVHKSVRFKRGQKTAQRFFRNPTRR